MQGSEMISFCAAGGRYKNWKRRWFILNDNCLYYFQYTTVSHFLCLSLSALIVVQIWWSFSSWCIYETYYSVQVWFHGIIGFIRNEIAWKLHICLIVNLHDLWTCMKIPVFSSMPEPPGNEHIGELDFKLQKGRKKKHCWEEELVQEFTDLSASPRMKKLFQVEPPAPSYQND